MYFSYNHSTNVLDEGLAKIPWPCHRSIKNFAAISDILSVACRGLVMPGATAWLDVPLPNSGIEQWRMVVIVTGYTLLVTSQYDLIFTFANQRFSEVCWHNMHIQGRWSRSRETVLSPRGGFVGLAPTNKAPGHPQIELWSTINRWSFYNISECQDPLIRRKAPCWKLSRDCSVEKGAH